MHQCLFDLSCLLSCFSLSVVWRPSVCLVFGQSSRAVKPGSAVACPEQSERGWGLGSNPPPSRDVLWRTLITHSSPALSEGAAFRLLSVGNSRTEREAVYLHQLYVVFYHISYYRYFKPCYFFTQYFILRPRALRVPRVFFFPVPGPAAVYDIADRLPRRRCCHGDHPYIACVCVFPLRSVLMFHLRGFCAADGLR